MNEIRRKEEEIKYVQLVDKTRSDIVLEFLYEGWKNAKTVYKKRITEKQNIE